MIFAIYKYLHKSYQNFLYVISRWEKVGNMAFYECKLPSTIILLISTALTWIITRLIEMEIAPLTVFVGLV